MILLLWPEASNSQGERRGMKSTGGGWHRLKTNPVTLVLQYSPETAMFFFKYKTGARGDSFGYPKVCCFKLAIFLSGGICQYVQLFADHARKKQQIVIALKRFSKGTHVGHEMKCDWYLLWTNFGIHLGYRWDGCFKGFALYQCVSCVVCFFFPGKIINHTILTWYIVQLYIYT